MTNNIPVKDAEIDLPDDILGPGKTFSNEEIAAAGDKVIRMATASEGINGPNAFSQEAAAYGYISRAQRVIYPRSLYKAIKDQTEFMKTPESRNAAFTEHKLNIIQVYTIAYHNFLRLIQGNEGVESAFFLAFYRARLTFLGYMYVDPKERKVTVDEVDWSSRTIDFFADAYTGGAHKNDDFVTAYNEAVDDEDRMLAYLGTGPNVKFKAFLNSCMTEKWQAIIEHIIFAAQQYAASVYLVFRQHGHHYTDEFERKYEILWRATTITRRCDYPGNAKVHRDAIHSFGMRCFHEKFYKNLAEDKLAETFVDRSDVAPAGTAIVATCHAAISAMKTMPVWDGFYMAYKDRVDALEEQSNKLKGENAEGAIKYHKNARLFGQQPFKLNAEAAEYLAPIAKGFIEMIGEEADLSRQKALDKRANQNPVMVQLVTAVLTKTAREIAKTADLATVTRRIESGKALAKRVTKAPGEEEEEEEGEE